MSLLYLYGKLFDYKQQFYAVKSFTEKVLINHIRNLPDLQPMPSPSLEMLDPLNEQTVITLLCDWENIRTLFSNAYDALTSVWSIIFQIN